MQTPRSDGRSTSSASRADPVSAESNPTPVTPFDADRTIEIGAVRAVDRDPAGALDILRALALSSRTLGPPVLGSFGDYEVIEKLASGGMGVVYLARQKSLGRTVALKMMLAGDMATTEELQRFRQEAKAAAQLDHKGIVPIYEVGEHEGQPFFSMGYLEGGSLSAYLKDGPLPCRRAVELVIEVAGAVSYAHEQGIIHRDLKPSNILLDRDGFPKVSDFGLAKQVSGLSHLTQTGQVIGTPSFMAPEQAAGKTHEIGPAVDLYSLGAVLYCLVTGRPPFQAATPIETLRQVLDQEPVSPRQLNSSVSRDLETICLKCLQKEPARRYESALALVGDLRRFLAGAPILARPVGSVERVWRWCLRNPRVAALGAGFVLSMILGIIATSYFWAQAARETSAARTSADLAGQSQELSERHLYAMGIGRAQENLSMGRVPTVDLRLDRLRPRQPGDADYRNFEWYWLARQCHLEIRTLTGNGEPVRGVAFSPDGRHVASVGGLISEGSPGRIQLWDSSTGETIRAWDGHAECVNCLAFSPDSARLVTAGSLPNRTGDVKLWDAATGAERGRLSGHADPVWGLAFSPDGHRLAGACGGYEKGGMPLRGEVIIWDLAGGKPIRLTGHETVVRTVAWSPDGRYLASADLGGLVRIWDAADLRPIAPIHAHLAQVASIAFSRDSRLLATGSLDRSIHLWETRLWGTPGTAQQYPLFSLLHSSPVHGLAFDPDNRRLAAGYEDRTLRIWDLASQRESLALGGHGDEVLDVAFSRDGWRVASGGKDGSVKIWDAITDRRTIPLHDHRIRVDSVEAILFSPDGYRLASTGRDGTIRLWDATTYLVTRTLRGHADAINAIAFRADGRWLCSAGVDRTARIWDTETGESIRTLDGFPSSVRSVVFAPDGRWLACAGGDGKTGGTVLVWELRRDGVISSQPARVYRDAAATINKITISRDGRWLAAGCRDGRIRFWNLVDGSGRTLRGHRSEVYDLVFSPDGQSLASGGEDEIVRLWSVVAGEEKTAFPGHSGAVQSVAFSPDGRRLVTAGYDHTVKFWDIRTSEEILSVPVAWAAVRLAFHRDGTRLAVGGAIEQGSDHTMAIWDSREQTPELRDREEARSRVAFLFARPMSGGQVREALGHDTSINAAVREQALALVDAYGRDLARREAEDLISQYTTDGLLRAEMLESFRTDPRLSEPVRREALALGETVVESPNYLDRASRAVVRRSDAGPSANERARLQAETASRLMPFRTGYQTTLGIAQYRVGKYREALDTLTRADELHRAAGGGPDPADLAFLAMAQYRLGRMDDARATLGRLRDLLKQPARGDREEAIAFRREAERLIAGEEAASRGPDAGSR